MIVDQIIAQIEIKITFKKKSLKQYSSGSFKIIFLLKNTEENEEVFRGIYLMWSLKKQLN